MKRTFIIRNIIIAIIAISLIAGIAFYFFNKTFKKNDYKEHIW